MKALTESKIGSLWKSNITNYCQESASRAIDLPDDDPDVLERFLQFLYTGTYEDGVNSTWGRPSAVAMMSHQEVAIRLEAPPGVSIPYGTSDEENPPDAATAQHGTVDNGVSASAATNSPNSEDDDERADGNYLPPEVGEFNEPEEEYNEFYAESDYDSDAPPSPSRRLWHVDNNLKGPLRENYQEVVGELATIRRDLFLPLRLYVMADKFDVPALRLLARERFYRAVEVSWSVSECFPQVIDELYRSTRDTDIAMRGIVCRLVANSLNEDQTREKLEPIMRLHADFAVDVLNTVLNSSRGTW